MTIVKLNQFILNDVHHWSNGKKSYEVLHYPEDLFYCVYLVTDEFVSSQGIDMITVKVPEKLTIKYNTNRLHFRKCDCVVVEE